MRVVGGGLSGTTLIAVALLALPACGAAETRTYTAKEVLAAFEHQGYTLVPHKFPRTWPEAKGATYYDPRSGEPFIVLIARNRDVEEAWPDFERVARDDDPLAARRANVFAWTKSQAELSDAQARRLLAALASLPDRGHGVDTVGKVPKD